MQTVSNRKKTKRKKLQKVGGRYTKALQVIDDSSRL
jgi:hypothetical protein